MEKIVVTRHKNLIEYLKKLNLIDDTTKIYLHNTGKKKFIYLVVIFPNEDSNTIQEIKYIEILANDEKLKEYKTEIIKKIKEINQFFDNMPELKKLYDTKYSRY